MSYRIAVVDDSAADTSYITSLVNDWAKSRAEAASVTGYASAEAFLFACMDEMTFDILLLDIEMGGMNGVELAKHLRMQGEKLQIIFITGFPDFIAEGYEVSALHYLMKPVNRDKLFAVLDRAAANIQSSERRLPITHDRETCFVPLAEIYSCEAQRQYVVIRTADDGYRMKASLSDVEKQLDEYFLRCQRSFVVNLRHVVRIKSDCVVLRNGAEVPISRGMGEKIGREIIRLF